MKTPRKAPKGHKGSPSNKGGVIDVQKKTTLKSKAKAKPKASPRDTAKSRWTPQKASNRMVARYCSHVDPVLFAEGMIDGKRVQDKIDIDRAACPKGKRLGCGYYRGLARELLAQYSPISELRPVSKDAEIDMATQQGLQHISEEAEVRDVDQFLAWIEDAGEPKQEELVGVIRVCLSDHNLCRLESVHIVLSVMSFFIRQIANKNHQIDF